MQTAVVSKLCVYKVFFVYTNWAMRVPPQYIHFHWSKVHTPVQRKTWINRKYVFQKSTFLTESSFEPFFNWSWHYELVKGLAFRKYVAREREFAFYKSQTYFQLIQIRNSIPLLNHNVCRFVGDRNSNSNLLFFSSHIYVVKDF